MGFEFHDVLITVFDIHPAIDAVKARSADFFQPDFGFLLDEQKYNGAYNAEKVIKTSNFEFRPLSKRERKTHFWKDYASITGSNPWKNFLPFVCKQMKINLKLNYSANDLEIGIRPVIHLSAMGWSTQIIIRLRGLVKNTDLINLLERVSSKTEEDPSFLIDNTSYNLTGVFRYFQNLLLEDIYSTKNPPHPGRKIQRHFVVSLNKFSGLPVDYSEMAMADKALMRSILLGKKFGALDEVRESELTPIIVSNPYNFALTEFDYGTLIFLQRDAQISEREAAVHCFAKNVSNCLMITFKLLDFYKSSLSSDPQLPISILNEQAKTVLCKLPQYYNNEVCKYFFLYHNSLKNICSPA